jgi:hypothetical protein
MRSSAALPDRRRPLHTAHLAAELLAAPVVEWLLDGIGPVAALCRLGLGRPGGRSLPVAVAVPALVLLDYPLVTAMTGAAPAAPQVAGRLGGLDAGAPEVSRLVNWGVP